MTNATLHTAALLIVVNGSYLRVAAVVLGTARTVRDRKRFATFRLGWTELLNLPEPLVLAATTFALHRGGVIAARMTTAPGPFQTAAAATGAVLVLCGWWLTIWAFLSWPTVFTGHGVRRDHRLVTTGAYGTIRHPIYAGVILLWVGLGIAFTSVPVILLTLLYVVPAYWLYLRSEEGMLREVLGDEYGSYQRAVPMLLPRRRPVPPPATAS